MDLSVDIVAAFVSNNSLPASAVAGLLENVHKAVNDLSGPAEPNAGAEAPKVPVRSSITPDYLICLDDGKHYKALRQPLKRMGMTPEQYRIKWGLPLNYPMVAPNLAQRRSALARKSGLGQANKPK